MILIDHRERPPHRFVFHPRIPVRVQHLPTGDYLSAHAVVERKSKADLYGTLGRGRVRFYREMERLASLPQARKVVIVESSVSDTFLNPPTRSRMNPKSVLSTVIALQVQYPTIRWYFPPFGGTVAAQEFAKNVLENPPKTVCPVLRNAFRREIVSPQFATSVALSETDFTTTHPGESHVLLDLVFDPSGHVWLLPDDVFNPWTVKLRDKFRARFEKKSSAQLSTVSWVPSPTKRKRKTGIGCRGTTGQDEV